MVDNYNVNILQTSVELCEEYRDIPNPFPALNVVMLVCHEYVSFLDTT